MVLVGSAGLGTASSRDEVRPAVIAGAKAPDRGTSRIAKPQLAQGATQYGRLRRTADGL